MNKVKYIVLVVVAFIILSVLLLGFRASAQTKARNFKRIEAELTRVYYNDTQFVVKITDNKTDCYILVESISCVK
jgi:flagellar basal body-associated protein FliL